MGNFTPLDLFIFISLTDIFYFSFPIFSLTPLLFHNVLTLDYFCNPRFYVFCSKFDFDQVVPNQKRWWEGLEISKRKMKGQWKSKERQERIG